MRRIRSRSVDRTASRRPLTDEELHRLRKGCRNIRDQALVEFLSSSGCRLSEAAGIRAEQVDWKQRSVRVLGKGRKIRTVFFSFRAGQLLREYLSQRDKAIAQLRHRHDRLIIGGNIGKNTLTQPSQVAADYLKMFRNLYQYVDYFSINVCCDNCADGSVSHNKAHLMNILQPLFDFRRGQNQYRPILLKISPDLPDPLIDEVTDLMLSTPLDGIVAVNGTFSRKGLETDEETLDEIGSGRLSGAPLTQRAIEVVRRIHRRSHGAYPIIGVGGLMNARDVKAMLAAGASLVQLYTGYIYEGPSLVKEICRALIDDAASEASASPAPGK